MAASQQSPNSSRTDTSAREPQPQQPAGAQQWFDAWMNAWQSVAAQAGANGASPMSAKSPMSPFAAMPDPSQFAAALQPLMQPLAGLKLPSASIPPQRLRQLQGD